MDRETNLDSILALEKQIGDNEGNEKAIVIQLKYSRNSLLNVSILLSPGILGSVFHWNAIPDGDFGGLPKGSYNFLLVCHHWFQVASCTPELWSFWGNSIEDWAHRHARCGTTPLDLVLETSPGRKLDSQLRGALQDRAARDTIRLVHLRGAGANLLKSVISSIVTQGEGTQLSGVESFIVQNDSSFTFVDISAFFRYRLPKLRCLRLSGCKISSWDLLKPQITVLTTLELTTDSLLPIPTLPQLLSVLSFNPLLRHLVLSYRLAPCVADSDRAAVRVQLPHLKLFHLSGNFWVAFRLLNWLELPNKMDVLTLSLHRCSSLRLSQTLGPYFGDHLRRRGRVPGGGLGVSTKYSFGTFRLCAGDVRRGGNPAEVVRFAEVSAVADVQLRDEEADGLWFGLISHIPWEQVIGLETAVPILRSEELCVEMRDLTYLHLVEVDFSTWFVEPGVCTLHAPEELLPGLDRIVITEPTLSGGDWSPLTNFLSRRAVAGNKISSLRLNGHSHLDEDVVGSIERAVGVFERVAEAPEDEGGE